MSSATAAPQLADRGQAFHHEALLYSDQDEFLAGTTSFLREALEADAPALVVVDAAQIEMLRAELGSGADRIQFADMAGVGANPGRIIPAWREFVDCHGGGDDGIWGIGEPIWPGRSEAELAECHRHEALLNVAFHDAPGFRLLCPYDTERLDPDVIHRAHCNHPVIAHDDGARTASHDYSGLEAIAVPFDDALPDPPVAPRELPFHRDTVRLVRRFVAVHAIDAGVAGSRVEDLVLAVDELASNSVRHGGGGGSVRLWEDDTTLVCEVRDAGRITDPLVGRVRPTVDRRDGRGLWLVQQLCDLVQVRSGDLGTVVRAHVRLR
jgi:anti-sigma regulatory factor (Ser/Thr protein kinase)